jgi:hypothetical protein
MTKRYEDEVVDRRLDDCEGDEGDELDTEFERY